MTARIIEQPDYTSEGGYTPGPWRLSDETHREGLLSRLVHGPGIMLAIVRTETQSGPIGDANARLIAAAPDMFEALQECEALLRDLCPRISHDGPNTAEEQAEYESIGFPLSRVRCAIAKATGAA